MEPVSENEEVSVCMLLLLLLVCVFGAGHVVRDVMEQSQGEQISSDEVVPGGILAGFPFARTEDLEETGTIQRAPSAKFPQGEAQG